MSESRDRGIPGPYVLPDDERFSLGIGRDNWGGLRFVFTGVWMLYLISPVVNLFGDRHSLLWTVGGLVIVVAFSGCYIWMIGTMHKGRRIARLGLPLLVVLALLACFVYGSDWTVLWIYVSAATGFMVPGRPRAVRAVLGVGACFALTSWVSHSSMGTFAGLVLPVLLIGVAMSGFRVQIELMQELGLARATVAKLAASEERLRLARDMHDLTGQSLSMITLKSELVRKLLSRLAPSTERDQAIGETTDISRVSRQTLHDIREAVSGYRRPTLAVEIITARTALEAAGIALDDDPGLTLNSGTFDAESEAALAWCLREAVTNVIRHSGASNCQVHLLARSGELSLEISDDGNGLEGIPRDPVSGGPASGDPVSVPVTSAPPATPAAWAGENGGAAGHAVPGAGSGLRGMSERLTAIGGRLSISHVKAGHDHRGLRLVATVPEAPARPAAEDAAPGEASPSAPPAHTAPRVGAAIPRS